VWVDECDRFELPEMVIRRPPEDVVGMSASFGKKLIGLDESIVVRRTGVDVASPSPDGDRQRFRSGLFSSGSSFLMTGSQGYKTLFSLSLTSKQSKLECVSREY
jgi:hypothetical protein